MRVTVLNTQSILDISIQHTGSVYNAFDIAVANGLSISSLIEPGTSVIIPEVSQNNDVLNYYSTKQIQPATGLVALSSIEVKRGIGWMKVGSTFKVE